MKMKNPTSILWSHLKSCGSITRNILQQLIVSVFLNSSLHPSPFFIWIYCFCFVSLFINKKTSKILSFQMRNSYSLQFSIKASLLKIFHLLFISCTESQYTTHTKIKNRLANKADIYKLFKVAMTELQTLF